LVFQPYAEGKQQIATTFKAKGLIEMSVSATTPMVLVTVDEADANGKMDGLAERVIYVQLAPDAAKPADLKAQGDAHFEDNGFLRLTTGPRSYAFVVSPDAVNSSTANSYSARAADVAQSVPPRGGSLKPHKEFLSVLTIPSLPPRRKPPQ
jgi:hypothetical protein